jgi:hypothetical protein
MRLVHIVGGAGAAHPSRHPARLQCIRQDVGPSPRDAESQQYVVQLGLRIGFRAAPATLGPGKVFQVSIGTMMHAGAEIDEPRRLADQCGQNKWRQRVNGKHQRKPIRRFDAARLPIANRNVVNDRIETPEPVHVLSNFAGSGNCRDIALDDRFGLRECNSHRVGALAVARVQHDLVACLDQQLCGHEPEPR